MEARVALLSTYWNYIETPHKAMAVQVNNYGQLPDGYRWSIGGGYTLGQARSNALTRCQTPNPQFTCVLEWENGNYVFEQKQADFRNQQYYNYIVFKRNLCLGYGFSEKNAIATCVQNEIARDQTRTQNQTRSTNQQVARQNQINSQRRSRAFDGISKLGETFLEMGKPKTPTRPSQMCVYQCGFEKVTSYDAMCPNNITYRGEVCYLN